MATHLFNNSENREHRDIYQREHGKQIAFDFYEGNKDFCNFEGIESGDTAIVLSYAPNGYDVTVKTYTISEIKPKTALDDGSVNQVILGNISARTQTITKTEAAKQYPDMFNVNDGFKRGVNIKTL